MLISSSEVNFARKRLAVGGSFVTVSAIMAELALVVSASIVAGCAWHEINYGVSGDLGTFAGVGLLTGLFYTLPFIFRSGYRIETLTGGLRGTARILNTWIYAFFCLAALAFLTKTTGSASRGSLALFFVIGGISVVAGIKVIEACVTRLACMGALAARRIIVVGRDEDVKRFTTMRVTPKSGIAGAASAIFPETENEGQVAPNVVETLVRDAVQRARNMDVKDVIILAQDGQTHTSLARMADRFLDLPVAVHLARTSLTEQFPHISIGQLGSIRTLTLRPAPLSTLQLGVKRALDLTAA
ncbi:MAG: hypothetical protein ACK5JT_09330, partial [Hyphomicrobiaceae bacterium]